MTHPSGALYPSTALFPGAQQAQPPEPVEPPPDADYALVVELWDDDVQRWADVTEHVDVEASVVITTGRRDVDQQGEAGTCSLTLLDPEGRRLWHPGSETSPVRLRPGLPLRVRVDYGGPSLGLHVGVVEAWPRAWGWGGLETQIVSRDLLADLDRRPPLTGVRLEVGRHGYRHWSALAASPGARAATWDRGGGGHAPRLQGEGLRFVDDAVSPDGGGRGSLRCEGGGYVELPVGAPPHDHVGVALWLSTDDDSGVWRRMLWGAPPHAGQETLLVEVNAAAGQVRVTDANGQALTVAVGRFHDSAPHLLTVAWGTGGDSLWWDGILRHRGYLAPGPRRRAGRWSWHVGGGFVGNVADFVEYASPPSQLFVSSMWAAGRGWPAEQVADRFDRLAGALGVPHLAHAVAPRRMGPLGRTDWLAALRACGDAAAGPMWVDPSGTLRLRGHLEAIGQGVRHTLALHEVQEPLRAETDLAAVATSVAVDAAGLARDQAAARLHGERQESVTAHLWDATDQQARAEWELGRRSTPREDVGALTLDRRGRDLPYPVTPMDRWQVREEGSTLLEVEVQGQTWTVGPRGVVAEVHAAPWQHEHGMQLDDPATGRLDMNRQLTW